MQNKVIQIKWLYTKLLSKEDVNNLTRQNIAGLIKPVGTVVKITEAKRMAIKIQQSLQIK